MGVQENSWIITSTSNASGMNTATKFCAPAVATLYTSTARGKNSEF